MTILITGVAGFIGHQLAQSILAQGHRVYGVDNFITGQKVVIENLSANKNFHFIHGDITDQTIWQRLSRQIDSCEKVFHLACPTGVPNCVKIPLEMLLTSSIGTRYVAQFAVEKKSRILFTSSSEIYGDPQVFPQTEKYWGNVDPIGLRSPYEEGKRYAESFLLSYVKQYKVKVVIARLFNTYGPGMNISETRVIPQIVQQALNNNSITVYGDGLQKRTFCYVDDMVEGLQLLMEKGQSGQVYNVGSTIEISMSDLALMIQKLTTSRSQLVQKKFPIPDHKRRLPDITKIQHLGWQQKITLPDGLQKTIRYFQELQTI